MDRRLVMAHERGNPVTCYMVDIAQPDVATVLRRSADQFLASPPRVSETPAGALVADPAGALTLAATSSTLAAFTHLDDSTTTHIDAAGLTDNHVRGLCWTMDPALGRTTLRSLTVNLKRDRGILQRVALMVYRRDVGATGGITFTPLLDAAALWDNPGLWPGDVATATFDLIDRRLELGAGVSGPSAPLEYYFVLSIPDGGGDDLYFWTRDRTSSRTIAGVGTFKDRQWVRNNGGEWNEGMVPNAVPTATIAVSSYTPSGIGVYALDLGAAPRAESEGRIVFERGVPSGTTATLELSTAGSGGPWTAVADGDPVPAKQQTYHARVSLAASADQHVAPQIAAFGVEFRIPVDVSAEATVQAIAQAVDVPFLSASIGEGSVSVVRTGKRDYHDQASELATSAPMAELEVDVRLGSRHPIAPRASWMLLERATVNNRTPLVGAEQFNLLSYRKVLKQKIPQRVETFNELLAVASSISDETSTVVVMTSLIPDGAGEDAYKDQHHYIRVHASAQSGVATGFVREIFNGSGSALVFEPPLPNDFAPGDLLEIHSARYAQPLVTWTDMDPADVWWEILTVRCQVPPERIGRGDMGAGSRSGLPPRITDRAPGDSETQARLRVTMQLNEPESAADLIDQLSFIMGGATIDIAGQIVFRQIYPLRDSTGLITVATESVAATFDVWNTINLQTPVGLEQRITQLAANYGADATAGEDLDDSASTTVFADGDAIAWLGAQPVDEMATSEIPKEIARWCFNSADGGLYLATQLIAQVVRAASTGLRVWSWSSTESDPRLIIGDRVSVITDQYTDYDPARRVPIRGWWAYTLVLISIEDGGRTFRGMMLGLSDAVQITGGAGTRELPDLPPGLEPAIGDAALLYATPNPVTGLTVDAALEVRTPTGVGGTAYLWVNHDTVDQPDYTTAAQYRLAIGSTPIVLDENTDFEVGPSWVGTFKALHNVRVHPTQGKTLLLEFVDADGRSTNQLSFALRGGGGAFDENGNLIPGAVFEPSQIDPGVIEATHFEADLRPPVYVTSLPPSGAQGDGSVVVFENKLHRWNATTSTWDASTSASDILGQLTTGQIADGAIGQTQMAAGLRVPGYGPTFPGSPIVGDMFLLTSVSPPAFYRWTGSAWTADVDAALIAGQVTETQISAGAISTPKLQANAVAAANIQAGAIVAGKLDTGAVTAGTVAAGAIGTNELQANAVTAAKILSGAVQADKLLVTWAPGGAINIDPMTSDESAWLIDYADVVSAALDDMGTSGKVGRSALFSGVNGSLYVRSRQKMRLDFVNKTYRIHGWVYNASASGSVYLGFYAYDKTGTPLGGMYPVANVFPAVGWTEFAATLTQSTISTHLGVPSSTIGEAQMYALLNYPGPQTGHYWLQDFRCEEVLPGTLIQDGAITTAKLVAGAVTTDKLDALAVTAGKVAAGAIGTTELQAGAVTAAKILAGSITADKLLTLFAPGAALNADPGTADITAWNSGVSVVNVGTGGKTGQWALRSTGFSQTVENRAVIPIDPLKTYRLRMWTRRNGANGGVYLGVRAVDGNGVNIDGPSGTFWYVGAIGVTPTDGVWTEYVGFLGVGGSIGAFPSNARMMNVIILTNYGGSVGSYDYQDVRLEEVVPGTLIQDGAITTQKLTATTVTAGVMSIATLSSITPDFGVMLQGQLQGPSGMYIDLSATGSNPVIHGSQFDLYADGSAQFRGDISAASGTFSGAIASSSFLTALAEFTGAADFRGTIRIIKNATYGDDPAGSIRFYRDDTVFTVAKLYVDYSTFGLYVQANGLLNFDSGNGGVDFTMSGRMRIYRQLSGTSSVLEVANDSRGNLLIVDVPTNNNDTGLQVIYRDQAGNYSFKRIRGDNADTGGSGNRNLRILN